jgi:hypothetical protein
VKTKKPRLVNAEAMSERHKDFNVLDHATRAGIPIGGIAKVCAGGERFWVQVTARDGDAYEGEVNSLVIMTAFHGLSYGDRISFKAKHVFDVWGAPVA